MHYGIILKRYKSKTRSRRHKWFPYLDTLYKTTQYIKKLAKSKYMHIKLNFTFFEGGLSACLLNNSQLGNFYKFMRAVILK